MSKQEEIREGVAVIVRDAGIRRFQREKPYAMHGLLADCANDIIKYLDEKGVVIKVDRELSIPSDNYGFRSVGELAHIMVNESGYGAFESLVEE